MAKKYANAFDMFNATETKTAIIKSLGDTEVEYRELTMAESDAFSKRLIKDYGTDGSAPVIDYNEATELKYEKASKILINPKMTVAQLKALPASAMEAINEITEIITAEPKEGN